MVKTFQCDLVVIGAGLAGLCAGVRASEAGLSVLVLERGVDADYICASRMTGGLFHVAMEDMLAPQAAVRDNIDRMMEGSANPAVADALARESRRTLDWLRVQGIRFIGAGSEGFRRNSLSPPGIRQTGRRREDGSPYWVGRSGDTMLRTLELALKKHGGVIQRGSQATQLLMRDGACAGVRMRRGDDTVDIAAMATVIADGGYQSDPELLERFIGVRHDQILQRNAGTGLGSGIRMAEQVGAKLVGTNSFYGHLVHRDAMSNDALWPYPVVDSLVTSGIVVDAQGMRFCDEGWGGVYITNEVARLENPLGAWAIFDQAIWEGPAKDWLLPPNPYLPAAGGIITEGQTLEDLAAKAGVDAQNLQSTVAAYNHFVAGRSGEVKPARRTSVIKAWPIVKAPFFAVPIAAGITYAMGGIATDEHARVLDGSDVPIAGLYAAGATTGGLEGGGHAGYSGGLSKSSVFGKLAAEHIVASTIGRQ